MDLRVTSGHIKLDFTEAVITQPTLHIDAEVTSGHITLITKPGIAVELDDVSVRSGQVKVRAPWGEGVPVFRGHRRRDVRQRSHRRAAAPAVVLAVAAARAPAVRDRGLTRRLPECRDPVNQVSERR